MHMLWHGDITVPTLHSYTCSTAPNGTIRHTGDQAYELGEGYTVPPGYHVWVPFWALHRSEQAWDRPDEFSIDRCG